MRQIKNRNIILIFILVLLTSFTSQKDKYSKNLLIGKSKSIIPLLKGTTYKLQVQAYDALELMKKDALKKGVKINVVSAYRSFEHQNKLWAKKFNKFRKLGYSIKDAVYKVKEYTAIPGTSRHHWGTEVDLRDNTMKNTKYLKSGAKSKYQKWMNENAHKYGFYLAYTNNKFRKGYKYESWHYSYRNISKPMLSEYVKLDISKVLKNEHIAGKSIFTKKFIQKYLEEHILGINDYLF